MEGDGSTVVFVIIIVIVNLEGDGSTVILVENLEDALNKERLRGRISINAVFSMDVR